LLVFGFAELEQKDVAGVKDIQSIVELFPKERRLAIPSRLG